jgi:maltooligosyltrehalose trehalohydrolase
VTPTSEVSIPISFHTLGAVAGPRATKFRVWAPDRSSVDLVICSASDARVLPLAREGDGYWSGEYDQAGPGTLYKFRIDGKNEDTYPDPASRFQPSGVHGPSAVVDPSRFPWTDQAFAGPAFDDLVIYELHVGTFSAQGTFRGATERLSALAELGVTAIELMPVADFAGDRNWGYDGVALFAPARCYGAPDDLRALVDAAHAHGLAVFLDVVYNHFGPDGAYANIFSPYYFTDAHESPWGRGVNLDGTHSEAVRRFFIENALHWVREYHVDGLRLDATHALVDDSPIHFLAEMTETVRAHASRPVHFIAEDHRNLASLLQPVADRGCGIDGVWADDFHHHARAHAAGDREGYYGDFSGSTSDLARTTTQGWFFTGQHSAHLGHSRGTDPSPLHPRQFVICIQNHDQIGNRADGRRLHHDIEPAAYRALSTLLLLAPETPMLFMGQEWAASSPFLYFTAHNAELGRKITEGRRQEFSAFAAFSDPAVRSQIPDPQALDTFDNSRLNWSELSHPDHAAVRALYARLLAVRRSSGVFRHRPRGSFTVTAPDDHTIALDYRGGLMVVARLSGGEGRVDVRAAGTPSAMLTTEDPGLVADPQPIALEAGDSLALHFHRPGAVVLARQ